MKMSMALCVLTAAALAGCGSSAPGKAPPEAFAPPGPAPAAYSKPEALALFDQAPDEDYRIGEGDALALHVWDRADLTGDHVVGPDGRITVPFVGPLRVAGLTRDQSAAAIKEALARFYANAVVTVRVQGYVSNQVVVVGRVMTPGVQTFPARPTLLEALARAGGIVRDPTTNAVPALTHCAVIRGKDKIAWLDLRRVLDEGDLSMNLRLRPGDVIFIPDWEDVPIYVLGEVERPGPLRWSPSLSALDAVARAGGLTRDAASGSLTLVRPSTGERLSLAQSDLFAPTGNVALRKGDILYVPTSLLADIGYVFEKINPFGWVFLATTVR